jgi:hypothetical protein
VLEDATPAAPGSPDRRWAPPGHPAAGCLVA